MHRLPHRSAPDTCVSSHPDFLRPTDPFVRRHLGSDEPEVEAMLALVGCRTLEELVQRTVPASIRATRPLALGPGLEEHEYLVALRALAAENRVHKAFLGLGYHGTITPSVILRNVLENPGWYTQYTPYQAEISQGRLEALLNFQTVVADLCALPLANASLLDEATAAAEALTLCHRQLTGKRNVLFISELCHPQTIAVVRTRAEALGIELLVGDHARFDFSAGNVAGVLVQYPASDGRVFDYGTFVERAHASGTLVVVATDLLALTLLRAPGEFGADVAVGSTQRFGVPMGFGGPHAAFLAAQENFRRHIPGRLIGLSKDAAGEPALRMALQTREQHIRREKATSNICTAQALLAITASFYAVHHGPDGLSAIAARVHGLATVLQRGLAGLGCTFPREAFFDTLAPALPQPRGLPQPLSKEIVAKAHARGLLIRATGERSLCIALDETATRADVETLLVVFAEVLGQEAPGFESLLAGLVTSLPAPHARQSTFLTHPVFHRYKPEHELLRYIKRLEARDLSLTTSMIPLGSCTMKLNAAVEMRPITWPEFADLHPFAPAEDTRGYRELFARLERALAEITGFAGVSLQPNAGSQGEYAGLLVIRAYHRDRGDTGRDVCLIPVSAHGTNPASAVMAGMKVVAVACDERGNVDLADLEQKAAEHSARLAALMVTYPSTHGVFEERITDICLIVHRHGGQVYMDGANMNAQVGLCRPGDFGADVCHLNLHKTFCIPHGGGGPGMGPICVAAHLAPYLPGHPLVAVGGAKAIGPVSAAPWGSPLVLPISYGYIELMGGAGLTRATELAILHANYMARRLAPHFALLFSGERGTVAHEFILDLRPLEHSSGVTAEDVAKRLMDYGFHAPTLSFPVAGTLMLEPTESESKAELDRLCDALIAIRAEIRAVEQGRLDRADNPLKNAPHTASEVVATHWPHPYPREQAAFPAPWTRQHKFWPSVKRIDNGFGDRNLVCTCPPLEAYAEPVSARFQPEPALPRAR
ncbi:MAG: aminomethyl-transferring glycine dehydrogenase, partial [Planctomycetes bacterium]|nr:aminomethyl-transferring glycine dehydrogenase [Planctomycetota bacterium]